MTKRTGPQCAKCGVKKRICKVEDGTGPAYCPTRNYPAIVNRANQEYLRPDVRVFAQNATLQEAQGYAGRGPAGSCPYPVKPRVQEIAEFADRMGYRKLGIAFCSGLANEARAFQAIMEAHGFEVVSVMCKAGGTAKETLGIRQQDKIHPGAHETMCSPIAQAMILNEEKTDFNILIGLCVGHDYLFFKYADAPTTVLVTKDRVLGHNPAAALHTSQSYYAHLLRRKLPSPRRGGA